MTENYLNSVIPMEIVVGRFMGYWVVGQFGDNLVGRLYGYWFMLLGSVRLGLAR